MSLPSGTCLGADEILTLIGSGGMGEVYDDPPARERFEREPKAISAVAVRLEGPDTLNG